MARTRPVKRRRRAPRRYLKRGRAMLLRILSIPSSVLLLAAIGGCATPNPDTSSGSGSGSAGGGSAIPAPAPAPQPQSAPAPAPAPPPPASTTSAEPSGSAQTPDERRAAIDRRLNDSLGTFDEQLRKEQERVAQERDAREGSGAASGTEGDADEAAKEGEGEAGTAETESPPVASTDG